MSDPINTIVTVNITATSATPSLPGTNIPAFIGYHTKWTDLIRTYLQPTDMLTDGFVATDPLYLKASALCAQNPRPQKFKIVRGTHSVAQVMHFTVTDNTQGDSVGLTVTDPSGVDHALYVTVGAGQTTAQVATALGALTLSGLTIAVDGSINTQVDITVNASGALWYPKALKGGTFTDATPTASPNTDLDAAILVDPDFYGISGTWMDATNIAAIAGWAQTNKRIHFYTTADSANESSPPSGVGGTLKSAADGYSFGQFCGCTPSTGSTPAQYGADAAMSQLLVHEPGSYPLAFKTEANVAIDALTPTQQQNLLSNNVNFNVSAAGLNKLIDGRMADGGWADIRIGLDAVSREIQLRVFAILPVRYTRAGINQVGAEVLAAIKSFIGTGFVSNDSGFEPSVTVPDLSTVSSSDKTARILRNVNFTFTAQGAVQSVTVNGTVSF